MGQIELEQERHVAAARTIGDVVRTWAQVTPDATAIVARNRRDMSYGDLAQHTTRIARQLREQGFGPASRVALVHRDGAPMITTLLGIVDCAAAVPLSDELAVAGLADRFAAMRIDGVLVDATLDTPLRDVARAAGVRVIEVRSGGNDGPAGEIALDLPPPSADADETRIGPNDTAFVFGTSGTTQDARLVPLRHRHMVSRSRSTAVLHELVASDRCLNQNRLFLCSGISNACAALYAGGSIAHPDANERFDVDAFFDGLLRLRPTWYVASYNFNVGVYHALEIDASRVSGHRLRFVRATSGRLAPIVSAGLEKIFGVPVIEAYSSTESGRICGNPLPPRRRKHGTVGRPTLGSEVAIVGEDGSRKASGEHGEVIVRGPNVFDGYDRDPAANDAAFFAGWYRTGDVGFFDEDGYLTLVGRTREMINRGGQKIAPVEVDEALLSHPDVADAAAFALPHPTLGEVVGAAVVVASDARLTEAEIGEHLRGRLELFKWPRAYLFVDRIPRGPSGKIRRQEVVALYQKLNPATTAIASAARPTLGDGTGNPTELKLAAIWSALLRRESMRPDDDFFALGGDSLAATQLVLTVNELFHVEMDLETAFRDATTIRTMAARIVELEGKARTGRNPDLPLIAIDERVPVLRGNSQSSGKSSHRNPAAPDAAPADLFVLDRDTGLRRMRPGARFGAVAINSHGYRSPEIAVAKPAGTVRFAFLGDSLTFGSWNGGNETTWPFHAIEALRRLCPGLACDYINAAAPGKGVRHVGVDFRDSIAKFGPDVVALSPGIGGSSAAWARSKLGYSGVHYAMSRLGRRSALAGVIEKNFVIGLRQLRALSDRGKLTFERHELPELSRAFRQELEDLVVEIQRGGSLVVLLTRESKLRRGQGRLRQILSAGSRLYYQPYMSISALVDVKDEFNRVSREICALTGAVLVDVADALPPTGEYFEDTSHCTPAANRVIGERFGQALAESTPFRELLRARSATPP